MKRLALCSIMLAGCAASRAPEPDARKLSEAGLYAEIRTKTLAPGTMAYAPAFQLWSDGASKARWVQLPAGTKIDTHDMDHWQFPVGTRIWKEFSLGGRRLETRLIERTGPGEDDYWMGAFIWKPDESEAFSTEMGRDNVNGTPHDVPHNFRCWACHVGQPGRVLGFSAIQLSTQAVGAAGAPAISPLQVLAADGRLTDPPPDGVDYHPPGDPATSLALGYLHANCGSCHNGEGTCGSMTRMNLSLSVADHRPEDTQIYQTTVGVPLEWGFFKPTPRPFGFRIVKGDPDASALVYRMSIRQPQGGDHMPPVATEQVDQDGLSLIRTWIEKM